MALFSPWFYATILYCRSVDGLTVTTRRYGKHWYLKSVLLSVYSVLTPFQGECDGATAPCPCLRLPMEIY